MAEKRMFTQKIIDSDPFLDMPLSTQALYFHLNMRADDDGFVNNPKRIQRMIGASEDDLKLLVVKRFIIGFESGIIVIKHWRMHNTLKSDRYKPTQYQEELAMLDIKDNKSYTERPSEPEWNHIGSTSEPQIRIEEKSIDKCSKEESISAPAELPAPAKETPVKHKYGEYGWVQLTDAQYARLLHDYGLEELNRCIKYVDESAQGNGNKNRWKDWNLIIRKCHTQQWGVQKGSWQRQMPGRTQVSEDEVEALRRMHAHITGGGK